MSFAIFHDPWLATPQIMADSEPPGEEGEIALVDSPVRTPAAGGDTTGTSFTINLPIGCNVAGRRLVVIVGKDGTGTVTWPGSPTFSVLKNETDSIATATSIAYRDLDGTEGFSGSGDTIAVTGASEQWGAVAYLISGADSGAAPEVSTVATGSSLTPDPGSLTPSWGNARNLWIACWTKDVTTNPQTGVPTDFTDAGSTGTSGAGTVSTGSAYRFFEGTSLNPSQFTVPDNTDDWMAYTIAVKPGAAAAGDDYGTVVAADAPIGWWRFAELAGTTANDESATANDGTYAGTPTLNQTSLVGEAGDTAVLFDGLDDAVSVPDHAAYDFGTDDFTLEAWVKFLTWPGGGTKTYVLSVGDPTNGTGFELECSSVANRFSSRIYTGSAIIAVQSATTTTVADNFPHHVVLTMDRSGSGQWYLDGLPYGSATDISAAAAVSLTSAGTLYIGRRPAGNYIGGTLDEVAIYDRLLTASEIAEHYTAGTP